ncbi:MAG TPA: hypothetical protein VGT78_00835 [Rhizomicrobium sp.]|nr:hypothetical protein [Rhizomicrobium sp.]
MTDAERTADALVKVHGEYALFIAARRANAACMKGDAESFRAWARVAKVIGEREADRGAATREHV